MSMKPKEALLKDGFISEIKRGRLSADAIERCKALAALGWDIEGYSVSKSTGPNDAPVVERVKVTKSTEIVDIGDEIRPEIQFRAMIVDNDGKVKEVGMRTCCNVCKASLTYCPCAVSYVWLDHESQAAVAYKPRTTPIPVKRWF